MTPSDISGAFSWCHSGSFIYQSGLNQTNGFNSPRMVINLKPNVIVASGTSTSSDPYVIK